MSLFRRLRADEIEVRFGQADRYGMTLLLYKDARCDQRILDETFTPYGWKRDVRKDEGTTITTLYIKSPDGEWIGKEGVGSAGNFEPEKSADSDSLKRAAFVWGLGRELYTAPRIHLKTQTEQDGRRYRLKNSGDAFGWKVSRIEYNESGISALELTKDGAVAYQWEKDPAERTAREPITADQAEMLEKILPPEDLKETLSRYGVKRAIELTNAEHAEIVRGISD